MRNYHICAASLFCAAAIFLFSFKTADFSLLAVCLVIAVYSLLCFILPNIFTYSKKKAYSFGECEFLCSAIKKSNFFCGFFIFLYAAIFLLNLYFRKEQISSVCPVLFSAAFCAFPQNIFFNGVLCVNKYIKGLKKEKIKIFFPAALDDIIKSKIIIVDEFESFLNLNALKSISRIKKIVLITKKSEAAVKNICSDFLNLICFFDASENQMPVFFAEKPIAVYCKTDISAFLQIIKKQSSIFITVCTNKISSPFCRINSNSADCEISLPQKDIRLIKTVFTKAAAMQQCFLNCFIYTVSISFAGFLCFVSIFLLQNKFCFSPAMFALLPVICVFLPSAALVCEKNEYTPNCISFSDTVCRMLIDSMLICVCCVIVFLIAGLMFSEFCARLICFNTFVFASLLYAFTIRTEKSVFLIGILKNKAITFSFFFGICAAITASFFIAPGISGESEQIGAAGWLLVGAMSVVPFAVSQLQKACTDIFKYK